MSYSNHTRNDERRDDPPHSRIFVVCGKHFREEELRPHFEKFGVIEDLYIPRDRNSGESKGVAYIKFSKTSSAAEAIQELHLKTVENYSKPIKVMVANSSKSESTFHNEERYKRLFIKVPKQATESDIRTHFSEFGRVDSVRIQRHKVTEESKGFAYVQYKSFVDAAKAYEECDRQYRPMFATPKEELKRSRSSLDSHGDMHLNDSFGSNGYNHQMQQKQGFKQNPTSYNYNMNNVSSLIKTQPEGYTTVNMTCSPQVAQQHVEKLFNIVPGMQKFQYSVDTYNGFCKALVTYSNESAAAFAVERLNNYEFPSGEVISVKPENQLNKVANDLTNMMNNFKKSLDGGRPDLMQLAEAIAQASTLITQATTSKIDQNDGPKVDSEDYLCNVTLPPKQPMLDFNSRVAKRCFIVCKPNPPPLGALRDVFSRFGDLVDVSTFPNKTFGFAKYASIRAADDAIKTLNGATVCGVRLKVLEADERPARDEHMDLDDDDDVGRKRPKMDF